MRTPHASSRQRSALMKRVRQKGTSAELKVAAALRRLGYSYRKNVRSLPGSPDFANQKLGWVVFVNGCYWHHHTNCRRATIPSTNRDFWTAKFRDNRKRDAKAVRDLRLKGFQVVLVWECETDSPAKKLSQLTKSSGIDMDKPVDQ